MSLTDWNKRVNLSNLLYFLIYPFLASTCWIVVTNISSNPLDTYFNFGVASCLSLGIFFDDDAKELRKWSTVIVAGWLVTFIVYLTIAMISTDRLRNLGHGYIPSMTTPLAYGVVMLTTSLFVASLQEKRAIKSRERKHKEKEERRTEIEDKLRVLVGNGALVQGFLLALDRLTRYVPDMAESLLSAVMADIEEYHILIANVGSTQNEVVRQRSKDKAAAIKEETRKLFATLTEEALEAIRYHEVVEADGILEENSAPRIKAEAENLRLYLEGLSETREIGRPERDRDLATKIDALGKPEKEIEKLPTGIRGIIAKIAGGNS